LLLAAAAAALVALVPGTASATPEHAPVDTYTGSSYGANAEFQLDDGRRVSAGLSQYRDDVSGAWQASLSLWISPAQYCYPVACDAGTGYAYVQLSADQVDFDRGLREFAMSETTVALQRWGWDPVQGSTVTEEEVSVSLVFTGTGPVNRWAEHGKLCGDGERECESIRNYAHRDADATLSLDGVAHTVTAPNAMWFAHMVDAAVPDFEYPTGN
jgi:hypothetical protein